MNIRCIYQILRKQIHHTRISSVNQSSLFLSRAHHRRNLLQPSHSIISKNYIFRPKNGVINNSQRNFAVQLPKDLSSHPKKRGVVSAPFQSSFKASEETIVTESKTVSKDIDISNHVSVKTDDIINNSTTQIKQKNNILLRGLGYFVAFTISFPIVLKVFSLFISSSIYKFFVEKIQHYQRKLYHLRQNHSKNSILYCYAGSEHVLPTNINSLLESGDLLQCLITKKQILCYNIFNGYDFLSGILQNIEIHLLSLLNYCILHNLTLVRKKNIFDIFEKDITSNDDSEYSYMSKKNCKLIKQILGFVVEEIPTLQNDYDQLYDECYVKYPKELFNYELSQIKLDDVDAIKDTELLFIEHDLDVAFIDVSYINSMIELKDKQSKFMNNQFNQYSNIVGNFLLLFDELENYQIDSKLFDTPAPISNVFYNNDLINQIIQQYEALSLQKKQFDEFYQQQETYLNSLKQRKYNKIKNNDTIIYLQQINDKNQKKSEESKKESFFSFFSTPSELSTSNESYQKLQQPRFFDSSEISKPSLIAPPSLPESLIISPPSEKAAPKQNKNVNNINNASFINKSIESTLDDIYATNHQKNMYNHPRLNEQQIRYQQLQNTSDKNQDLNDDFHNEYKKSSSRLLSR